MRVRTRAAVAIATVATTSAAVLAGGAGIASATGSDGTSCSTGRLPNVVIGSPGVKPGQATGAYLWHGSDGYSLRATHPGSKRVVFTGTLTASSGFSHVKTVAYEKSDSWSLSSDHRTLRFRFANYGRIDGLDFAANCSRTVRVSIRINSKAATPRQIKLGAHRSNPTSNPFTIQRSKPAPTATASATPTATIG